MSQVEETFEAPLSGPDPFALPKDLRAKLKSCCGGTTCADKGPERVEYLWLNVSKHGFGRKSIEDTEFSPLALEDWLNIIDEAASLGAKGLVVSVSTSLAAFPELVSVCQWAQDSHGMCVAVHTTATAISTEDIAALKQLDLSHVRLFVTEAAYPHLKQLESDGLRVCIADAEPTKSEGCGMPQNMVFVNVRGQLYTCGMVEGRQEFHLGNIFDRRFDKVMADPALPHTIPADAPHEEHGCDGCPPLLSRLLKDN